MLKFYKALFDSIILANQSVEYAAATHLSGQKKLSLVDVLNVEKKLWRPNGFQY
jgi:hypothetical protein